MNNETKKCTVCAEEINKAARKCKVCDSYQTVLQRLIDFVSSSFGLIAVIVSVLTSLYVTYVSYASISGKLAMYCRIVDDKSIAVIAGKTGNIPALIEKVTIQTHSKADNGEPKELYRKDRFVVPVISPKSYSSYIYQNEVSSSPTSLDRGGDDSTCRYEVKVLFRDMDGIETSLKEILPCIE